MTVQSCHQMRDGAWSGSGTITGGNRYQVSYLVETNDSLDGPLQIVTQAEVATPDPIPGKYVTYAIGNDFDNTVVHKQRSSRKLKDITTGALWQVDCVFERPGVDEQNDLQQPTKRPVKYRIEWAQFTIPATKDIFGNPIVNTANQPYPEPIEMDDARPVFVAEKNLSSLWEVQALATIYRNAINSDVYQGAPIHHAKVESITCGQMEEEDGEMFWPTVFRIQINNQPWYVTKKEEGYKKYNEEWANNDVPDRLEVASDFAGSGHAEPILLTADGKEASVVADPIYTTWRVYPERNFSGLGI